MPDPKKLGIEKISDGNDFCTSKQVDDPPRILENF